MNKYEMMFIIDPALDEAKTAAAIENVKSIISENGEVLSTDDLGLRRLAYPILKKSEGHYVVVEFTAAPELPKELDRRLRISDDYLRQIIVCKD